MSEKPRQNYPQAGPAAGRLIRQLLSGLRRAEVVLPHLTSHILIAISGGSDSIALAKLIAKYGRKAGPRNSITVIHINHGWRGEASDGDARFVRKFARENALACKVFRVNAKPGPGESWEDAARRARERTFQRLTARNGPFPNALIFTAHHADDLAETYLWRLFTGTTRSHGGGILARHGNEVRPLLAVRKKELQAFLLEEAQVWREDQTNFEGTLLRARMRREVMPALEALFPRAIDHLVKLALAHPAQGQRHTRTPGKGPTPEARALVSLLGFSGLRLRRAHWEAFSTHVASEKSWQGEIHLPAGWVLRAECLKTPETCPAKAAGRRWILERR